VCSLRVCLGLRYHSALRTAATVSPKVFAVKRPTFVGKSAGRFPRPIKRRKSARLRQGHILSVAKVGDSLINRGEGLLGDAPVLKGRPHPHDTRQPAVTYRRNLSRSKSQVKPDEHSAALAKH
jgi:hypothetical protein